MRRNERNGLVTADIDPSVGSAQRQAHFESGLRPFQMAGFQFAAAEGEIRRAGLPAQFGRFVAVVDPESVNVSVQDDGWCDGFVNLVPRP